MPGLVDLHYHTAIGRGWSDHLPLWQILQEFWYPVVRAIDPEAVYWSALASYAESIRGVTTVNDMYRHIDALGQAAQEIGIRAVLSNIVADPEHGLDSSRTTRLATDRETGPRTDGSRSRSASSGCRWLRSASCRTRASSHTIWARGSTSISTSPSARSRSRRRSSGAAPRRSRTSGILGSSTVAAHCVWLSDTEIGLMRDTGTHISHNPTSNASWETGWPAFSITCKPGSTSGSDTTRPRVPTGDMFEVMKFASLMQRAVRMDANVLQAGELLRMVTRNGSDALRHETACSPKGRRPTSS